jgi:D-tyrosyl-tRNA(Tyr) deacylase
MRAVIQRVSKASVNCSSGPSSEIGAGLLVFLGVEEADDKQDIEWLSSKICRLRIFDDRAGVMNLSLIETGGEILVISQFTLHASTRKGNRPSYMKAAAPQFSEPMYLEFIKMLEKDSGMSVKKGIFGDHMDVLLVNDGPVTILIDTKNKE